MDYRIDRDAVQCRLEAHDQSELFRKMASPLIEAKCVTEDFPDHVAEREAVFPTGLPLGNVGFAIPHTDPEYVHTAAVSIATLSAPIDFRVMGDPEESVKVSILFMLALTEGHQHLEMLQRVVAIAQDQDQLNALLNAASDEELFDVVSRLLAA